MQILNALGTLVNTIVLSIVVLLFIAGVFYQVAELIKKK
jgi:hypothetical protein